MSEARLTSSDPEPPIGSRVLDDIGMRWMRHENGYWLPATGGDPESWVKVADNYGPVRLEVGEMTVEDVLTVLNDLEPVDMAAWTFAVITDASSDVPGTGRMAGRTVDLGEPRFWPFQKGEIIVLDGGGREPFGEGRKPAKWDVHDEQFTTLAEAKACREQVLAGTWPRYYDS